MEDLREVERALSYMDADSRDTWYKMAFAVRDALGEEGPRYLDALERHVSEVR